MLRAAAALFDDIDAFWESARMRRAVAAVLVVGFLVALAAADAAQRGWLPAPLRLRVPHGHFFAVELALWLLLSWEVVGLVLGIARSVSSAAGKQFEIFSLILLRHSFEEFAHFGEPLAWAEVQPAVGRMLANGFGALLIFVVLGFYYGVQRHLPLTGDARDRESFIASKKAVSLVLVAIFAIEAGRAALSGGGHGFFESFYVVLVFADILVVLLSLRYSSAYHVVFRNSGLAVATVLLRLALSAPPYWSAALGLGAAIFALGLAVACNRFAPAMGAGVTCAPAPAPGGAPGVPAAPGPSGA
jgi:hypothetical protein